MGIHIWDLKEMDANIVVEVKTPLKDQIKKLIKTNIYFFAKELKIKPTRLYEYFIWKKSMIPLKILMEISKKANIKKEEIEKNIIVLKQQHVPSKNSIKNPKLPIQISPYLTSIVSHLFFDGSMPKDGKGTYYNQKDNEIMGDFIKRVRYIFGEVYYSLRLDHRGVLKCRIPRIVGEICKYIYKVDSFGSFDSRIPPKIFSLNKDHKVAFVLAGILDEGSITYDGSIQFGVSNKKMMVDFKNLCAELNLDTTPIKEGKLRHYYLYISSREKLYQLNKSFTKKYPLFSLRYKGERLKKALEIKKKKFFYTKNFADKRKALILNELKKNKCSVNFLASKLLIDPRAIRRYMYSFMIDKKVKREKSKNEYIYSLM